MSKVRKQFRFFSYDRLKNNKKQFAIITGHVKTIVLHVHTT